MAQHHEDYPLDGDVEEQEPLDSQQREYEYEHNQQNQRSSYINTSRPVSQFGPGAHPDSAFNRLRAERQAGESENYHQPARPERPRLSAATVASSSDRARPEDVSPLTPPDPPPHREHVDLAWSAARNQQQQHHLPPDGTTPGADNFGEAAVGGGVAGIAYSVAERNARESGLRAMDTHNSNNNNNNKSSYHNGQQQQQQQQGSSRLSRPYSPPPVPYGDHLDVHNRESFASSAALSSGAAAGEATPPMRNVRNFGPDVYTDDPYGGYLYHAKNANLGVVNPNEIDDDGDDGLVYGRGTKRTSLLSLGAGRGNNSNNNNGIGGGVGGDGSSSNSSALAVGAAAGTAGVAGGVMGALAGARGGSGGHYTPVSNPTNPGDKAAAAAAIIGARESPGSRSVGFNEKSQFQSLPGARGRKWRLAIIIVVAVLVFIAIALGIVFGVVLKRNGADDTINTNGGGGGSGSSSSNPESTAGGDTAANGDLDINSPEIQALLNNTNLHKVFPGIDYTPINTQYPACLTDPPSQNNVTRDVAVLSQLSNTIRLYGTDCNQTEMVIHAVNQLQMDSTIKIWMGVWQDNNDTTNARQLAQMWSILDTYGDAPFKGVIVANEILYRQQMTAAQLGDLLDSVRQNITSMGLNLPVATSDLGDNWTSSLASQSDYIMSNIHPFFAGVNASFAASWTYSFWENQNAGFFKTDLSKNVISETGWPSQGGTDCGTDAITVCPGGSVAGIPEMNTYMGDWVCQALSNGTQYFWFEMFDEPWKIVYDTGDQNWEDHWGLLDVDRNLKDGVIIPDCGGKTVD